MQIFAKSCGHLVARGGTIISQFNTKTTKQMVSKEELFLNCRPQNFDSVVYKEKKTVMTQG